MLSLMLTDVMACLMLGFDPILDHYFMFQFSLLFAYVGRWSTLRPTLDAGVSSVLLFCLLILAAMLECCFFLSCIHDPCMRIGVWALWLLFSRFASSF